MTIKEALSDELDNIVESIKKNLQASGKNTTGKTAESPRKEIKDSGTHIIGQIIVPRYFGVLETGRRPTPDKKPGREMLENIREWADAKGLDDGIEWAIATKINKEGTKLWKDGGRKDIFTPVTDDNAMSGVTERIGKVAAKSFAESITKVAALK